MKEDELRDFLMNRIAELKSQTNGMEDEINELNSQKYRFKASTISNVLSRRLLSGPGGAPTWILAVLDPESTRALERAGGWVQASMQLMLHDTTWLEQTWHQAKICSSIH